MSESNKELEQIKLEKISIVVDTKGDLLRKYGNCLKEHGITIKSFNLINPEATERLPGKSKELKEQ